MPDTLLDRSGRPCATYETTDRDGRPMADLVAALPGRGREVVVAALFERLPGWFAGTEDLLLAAALEAAGARRYRYAHLMTRDLRAPVARAAEVAAAIVPFAALTDELVAADVAAYPSGHPDHLEHTPGSTRRVLERIVSGEEVGPLLACSRVAQVDGRDVGAALIADSGGAPPDGGPWLAELFRAPGSALRGVGAALLAASVAAAREDGLRSLGLAVSDGNPAASLYARMGFERVTSAITVVLPPSAPAPPAG